MKAIVIYKSKYGATEKYARWIAEALKADVAEMDKFRINKVHNYDTVIIGSGVYGGSISGYKFIKNHILALSSKNVFVFAVGASPASRQAIAQLRIKHFPRSMDNIPLYYMRGAWMNSQFSFKDRTMANMVTKSIAKKNPGDCEAWERAIADAAKSDTDQDWTDRDSISELVNAVRAGKKETERY